jgi:hypothetical protein
VAGGERLVISGLVDLDVAAMAGSWADAIPLALAAGT